jgi:L-alanine-DL-glutamate epimerase-like enolase superfamily enzyme
MKIRIERIVSRMDRAAKVNHQAKAVVDYALHDIMGKSLRVPVYKLLGGLSTVSNPLKNDLAVKVPRYEGGISIRPMDPVPG